MVEQLRSFMGDAALTYYADIPAELFAPDAMFLYGTGYQWDPFTRAELARTLRRRLYEQWRGWADSTSHIAIVARLGR